MELGYPILEGRPVRLQVIQPLL